MRNLGRLDGFLTPKTKTAPRPTALGFVRAHATALGLQRADLDTFVLRRDYVDIAGAHHLSWTQRARGVMVFGNGLKANVSRGGQLISVQGAPISDLAQRAASVDLTPALSAESARSRAAKDVGTSAARATPSARTSSGRQVRWSNRDRADLVWFFTTSGLHLAWSTYVQTEGHAYQHVLDARSGAVLYRHDTVAYEGDPQSGAASTSAARNAVARTSASSRGQALVFDSYPGAPAGGRQKVYDLIKHGMLTRYATTLSGSYVVAWADVNDNDRQDLGESVRVPGLDANKPQYPFVAFNGADPDCKTPTLCTWDPAHPSSWQVNASADVTQGFYFNSVYHDYLLARPFGFTRAAGNFETRDGDPIFLNALDGAATGPDGGPDAAHVDNANMSTPPDGLPPTMQMYLFRDPAFADDPFRAVSSSFDADVVLHEYTHGLSNRLVVDADGNSALGGIQAGAMGEAWSDYYAEDYLVAKKLKRDTASPGEIELGSYTDAVPHTIRSMGLDCPVATSSTSCPSRLGGTGGYTYGDFSTLPGGAEVHRSGEIWGQTLWDLRQRVGHRVAAMLITRAMELSPDRPTFLDMRNAILQADLSVYGGRHRSVIWRTFAHRGMGFFAAAIDSADVHPVEDFSLPPRRNAPRADVTGRVTNSLSGAPIGGAVVSVGGHGSGFPGDYAATTGSDGRYRIRNVFVGSYPLIIASAPGYERKSVALRVSRPGAHQDFVLRRDWAAASGGGSITAFNGPDYSPVCGPGAAIDLASTGWGSTTGNDDGDPTNVMIPKYIEVKLPAAIRLTAFGVDPSNTCGDDATASTAGYRIETSSDGQVWTVRSSGTFTDADRGRINEITLASPVTGVRFIRFTMLSPQVPDFATTCPTQRYSGCYYTDMTELGAYGTSSTT